MLLDSCHDKLGFKHTMHTDIALHCIQNKLFDINSEASTIKKNESYFTACQYLTDPGRKWLLLQPVLAVLVNNKWSSFCKLYH